MTTLLVDLDEAAAFMEVDAEWQHEELAALLGRVRIAADDLTVEEGQKVLERVNRLHLALRRRMDHVVQELGKIRQGRVAMKGYGRLKRHTEGQKLFLKV